MAAIRRSLAARAVGILLLSGCSASAPAEGESQAGPQGSAAPPDEASVVAESTTTTADADAEPVADQTGSSLQRVELDEYGLSIEIPVRWEEKPGYREEWVGADGFVQVAAWGGSNGTEEAMEEIANRQASHHLKPYGTSPTIETLVVDGRPARLIWPSTDGTTLHGASQGDGFPFGELLVLPPTPVLLDSGTYQVVSIVGDLEHLREVAASLAWDERTIAILTDEIVIIPDGPYIDGQTVTVLASSRVALDTYNSSPRLCAVVDDSAEYCDPSWARPVSFAPAPLGSQGVEIELFQVHFGPTGDRDCGDDEVQCRLLWRTESGGLLASDELLFVGPPALRAVSLEVTLGSEPGSVTVQAHGLNPEASLGEILSYSELSTMVGDIESVADFDPDLLAVTWEVSAFCGFGSGDPPIGSDGLEDPPAWWAPTTLLGDDAALTDSFFGANCDWLAIDGPRQLTGEEPVELDLRRHIYGYGGWHDCAVDVCYLEFNVRWTHPMPDGSTVGSEVALARAIIDVPDHWPSIRPSISIVEPGPYRPGQEVTVEVRAHQHTEDGVAIGWCGVDVPCRYHFSTFTNGVHRVTWQIPPSAAECGEGRCYFEISSQGEGMAPPAIVIVPVVE